LLLLLVVEAGDGPGGWLGGEPLLLGLLEPLHLPAGLRVVGPGVVEPDAQSPELDLEGDPAAAAGNAGEDCPLSVSTLAGIPQRTEASWKAWRTSGPVTVRRGTAASE
jgi:hypothetical protein